MSKRIPQLSPDVISGFRKEYPEYKDIPDSVLFTRLYEKHYSHISFEEFQQRLSQKYTTIAPSQSKQSQPEDQGLIRGRFQRDAFKVLQALNEAGAQTFNTLDQLTRFVEEKTGLERGRAFELASSFFQEGAQKAGQEVEARGGEDLMTKIVGGATRAAADLPLMAATGIVPYTTVTGAAAAYEQGDNILAGALRGAVEGTLLHGFFKGTNPLPRLQRMIADAVAFGGEPVINELQKPEDERDWEKVIADLLIGAGFGIPGGKGKPVKELVKDFRQAYGFDVRQAAERVKQQPTEAARAQEMEKIAEEADNLKAAREEADRAYAEQYPEARPPEQAPAEPPAPGEKKNVPGERTLPKSLEEVGLEGGTDRFYDVYSDEAAMKKANDRIAQNEEAAYQYAKSERSVPTKEQVTTGLVLLERLNKRVNEAQTDAERLEASTRAVELANALSRRLTQAGQTVQAASVVSRLSPEGILLYAERRVREINEKRPGAAAPITPEVVQKINTLSADLKKATDLEGGLVRASETLGKLIRKEDLTSDDINALVDTANALRERYGSQPVPEKPGLRSRVVESLAKFEEQAKKRLRERGYNLNAGLDPGTLADFAAIGAAKMAKTGIKFLDWSAEMVKEYGEPIRPHLKRIYNRAVDVFKTERSRVRKANRLDALLRKTIREIEANPNVTRADLDQVQRLVREVEGYSGDAKIEALNEIEGFLQSLERPTIGRRIATAQTIGQLLNPKTQVRNIIGNEIFYRLERLNKYIATPIDWAASKLFGGERTITFKRGGQTGFWEGWMKGARAGWNRNTVHGLATQFDLQGPAFRSKWNPLTWMEKALGASLRSFDTASFERGYRNALGEMAELDILRNKRQFASKEERQQFVDDYIRKLDNMALEMAAEEGKYLTFQDENIISRNSQAFKRVLNLGKDFGIGDLVLKYPKTPANLLHRALEYSPAGFLRSAYLMTKAFASPQMKQRAIVNSISRAITGTFGLTLMGAILYENGVLTGATEKERKIRDFKAEQTGERNYQINITAIRRYVESGFDQGTLKVRPGDTLVSFDWAQPVALSLAVGANAAKNLAEHENVIAGIDDIAYNSLEAGINTIAEQPLVTGVRRFLGGENKSAIEALAQVASDIPASFTPTFLSQIRQFIDNDRRITYDPSPLQKAINRAIYKIPFVNRTLPKAFKTFGGVPAEAYKDGTNTLFNVFFNPAFISKYSIDPDVRLILDPYLNEKRDRQFPKTAPYSIRASKSTLDEYGLTTEKAFETFELTGDDISEFQKRMSEYVTDAVRSMDIDALQGATYEEQESEIASIVNESYEETKRWFFENKAKNYLTTKEQGR